MELDCQRRCVCVKKVALFFNLPFCLSELENPHSISGDDWHVFFSLSKPKADVKKRERELEREENPKGETVDWGWKRIFSQQLSELFWHSLPNNYNAVNLPQKKKKASSEITWKSLFLSRLLIRWNCVCSGLGWFASFLNKPWKLSIHCLKICLMMF